MCSSTSTSSSANFPLSISVGLYERSFHLKLYRLEQFINQEHVTQCIESADYHVDLFRANLTCFKWTKITFDLSRLHRVNL